MAKELKTKPTKGDVAAFLQLVEPATKQADCLQIAAIMQNITGCEPTMWGPSIVGFGSYHYKYPTGNEGDWFLTGFSPRKQNITLYLMCGLNKDPNILDKLGKYKMGKSCLYIKKLEDIDIKQLKLLISNSLQHIQKMYPN